MRKTISLLILLLTLQMAVGQTTYQKDFAFYWQTVKNNFAYFDKQHCNWDNVRTIYQPVADTLQNRTGFVHFLEAVNHELYNGHVFLNTNTQSSNRPIPTGADLKVSWSGNKFVITEIREGFNADLCDLRPGMEITRYNTIPVIDAIRKFLPRSAPVFDKAMYEYAANTLLAGTHDVKRIITVLVNNREQTFYPDAVPNKTDENYTTVLEAKKMTGNIGYIKINNSLGNSALISSFDKALDSMMQTTGLILDLRETPSGGTSTIARAIMGRFIQKEQPYQKHIYTAEEKETGIKRLTIEMVAPRLSVYKKPLVVLVGYWTGSMGEGMAIGFDAMKRATIMGTQMAGLLGEIYSFETPETKIPFSFPCVQLQHINGQAREDFMPLPFPKKATTALEKAIADLVGKKRK